MRLKFHVTYRSSKQIVELESANEKGNVAEITKFIYEQFKIPRDEVHMQLQYFDQDFEDWVDVASDSSLVNMTRLKVITAAPESDDAVAAVPMPLTADSISESPERTER